MPFEQGFGLVVGVGGDLPMTVTDAEGLYGLLVDPNRCAYPASHVTKLTEAAANKDGVLTALDDLAARTAAVADATVLVYFSGHGYEVKEADRRQYYLWTHGCAHGQLDDKCIRGDVFADALAALDVRKLVVILDCCFAGGFERTKAPGVDLAKAPVPFDVSRLGGGQGRVIFASSMAGEESRAGHPYSAFTRALLEGLAGVGGVANGDGFAYVSDVFGYVSRVVPQRTGESQHPVLHSQHLTNFPLAYYAAGAKAPNPLPWMVTEPAEAGASLTASQRRRLQVRLDELSARHATVSDYVRVLEGDLEHEGDGARRLSLQWRLDGRLDDRRKIEREMEAIEARLGE